ncbi:MAG: 23S rRNA (guanosine(2251)-2'-O)-methyltransferase RlmB [Gammaproteobacteria bacterium]|nr:23S rRNA (guanosine(2251)-2'-O)-methyltransferase RlmB [Gammaproteobacteria bacterium]
MVMGIHAVTELLNQHPTQIKQLLVQEGRSDARLKAVLTLADAAGISAETVARKDLDENVGGSHQGVAARCEFLDSTRDEKFLWTMLDNIQHDPLILVLDEITDPHNLGACLRTADAAGVDAVIIPKNRSAALNMTVRKVASGAAETVNLVAITNLSRTLKALQQRGIWVVGTAGEATKSLHEQDLTGPLAVVMGSEGHGLRRLTREGCDFLVSIPMSGKLSSLNVSVATGICLFEVLRQRQK